MNPIKSVDPHQLQHSAGWWRHVGRITPTLIAASVTGACASYEAPRPGVHRAPGDTVAEAICGYETPTASRFMQMRCRSAEDVNRTAADARSAADSIRMPAPDIR